MTTLGIIGGLGPMATVVFLKKIIDMTEAGTDQEHISMNIAHYPCIPDRTKYMLGESGDNPVPALVCLGNKLADEGTDAIAIPCVTAHFFMDELSQNIRIPIIDGVELTGQYLKEMGCKSVGLLGTDGTIRTGFLQRKIEEAGIECHTPSDECQKLVMKLIYDNVKAGRPVDKEAFTRVSEEMHAKGAEVIVLGCTELSVIADGWLPSGRYLDMLDVLARACVLRFGKLRPEYGSIEITKKES
ncbi:MAG: amino acid racemase [Lachnospiraceae bacterium]|nr:amino acid racemase [Lachnospiraceae bacterium]